MDQIKIGRFIAACRKDVGLTQAQLAEKLNVTDRAVSKWERGLSLPDSSIMLTLCGLLGITVNDLLSGERVIMENYHKEMEQHLLQMVKEKEAADKRLLRLEVAIGVTATAVLFLLVLLAAYVTMATWLRVALILFGFAVFLVGCFCALRIEQVAGYYACDACGHRYVPTFWSVNLAMHMGRTRYMRCPHCGKKTWQKKVLRKE